MWSIIKKDRCRPAFELRKYLFCQGGLNNLECRAPECFEFGGWQSCPACPPYALWSRRVDGYMEFV